MRFPRIILLSVSLALLTLRAVGQSPYGNINGLVLDPSNRVIVGAEIIAVNDVTNLQFTTKTNNDGVYVLPNLPPGPYRLQVSKVGFKTIIKPDITLNVQDAVSINFTLPVGALLETVTVQGGAPLVNAENATVSTVVDRNFVENLPMNGRSFQTLIELTPGVVVATPSIYDGGQFSVNGQRATSNYWIVDGVSANIGIAGSAAIPGNGFSGSLGSFSALGGTNSLVSVDALQEFRIVTSTYAPEFGRTPGGQISILTRSGTNQFHGTAFDYLRNDIFDANDWFADHNGLPKPEERQNDFGGTLGGPILKDRTFFFFSYEGLRLRLPQVAETSVPDLSARQSPATLPVMRPYLNAFPVANGPEELDVNSNPTGAAQFNASFSNAATLDAYSLRIDHKLNKNVNLFGRYNYSPSSFVQRGFSSAALSVVEPIHNTTQTATAGVTWMFTTSIANDFRFNYSRTSASSHDYLDGFGGATPLPSLPLPSPFSNQNGFFDLFIASLAHGSLTAGQGANNLQRQINLVDTLSVQIGSHALKFGVDFRRLSPVYQPYQYSQEPFFFDMPSTEAGILGFSFLESRVGTTTLFHNLGVFAQDTWKIIPRLTLTYGLRWDVDLAPSTINGASLIGVTGFNLSNPSDLALAPPGTPPFSTTYGNVAPRVGMAYQISASQQWQTVLRGGFGVFYDLATSEASNLFFAGYPFEAAGFNLGGTFPLNSSAAAPPSIIPSAGISAFNPHLELPYTLEWNIALEQAIGTQQAISATYIGSVGRRLIQSTLLSQPNPDFADALLVGNTAISDYQALQIQYQRRLSHGFQALASYTWSHSIDTASAGSVYGNIANSFDPSLNASANRGPSDFDIRNAFSAGVTYDIPAPRAGRLIEAIARGWSLQSVVQARSAAPVDITDGLFVQLNAFRAGIRPDVVPGIPLYLYGPEFPGGKAFNNTPNQGGPNCLGPFCPPPTDANGNPLRQGNLGRNALRGFGATQWDFSVHRDFAIREPVKLQFRAEMFNVLNHPNFGPPVADLSVPQFGLATQMLAQSLSGGIVGAGGFNPLYQIGGPRSIQLALKLMF